MLKKLWGAAESQPLVFLDEVVHCPWARLQLLKVLFESWVLSSDEGEAKDVPHLVDSFHASKISGKRPAITSDPCSGSVGADHLLKEPLHQLHLKDEQHHLGFGGADLLSHLSDPMTATAMVQVVWQNLLEGYAHPCMLCIPQEFPEGCVSIVIIPIHHTHPVPAEAGHELDQGQCLVLIAGDGAQERWEA